MPPTTPAHVPAKHGAHRALVRLGANNASQRALFDALIGCACRQIIYGVSGRIYGVSGRGYVANLTDDKRSQKRVARELVEGGWITLVGDVANEAFLVTPEAMGALAEKPAHSIVLTDGRPTYRELGSSFGEYTAGALYALLNPTEYRWAAAVGYVARGNHLPLAWCPIEPVPGQSFSFVVAAARDALKASVGDGRYHDFRVCVSDAAAVRDFAEAEAAKLWKTWRDHIHEATRQEVGDDDHAPIVLAGLGSSPADAQIKGSWDERVAEALANAEAKLAKAQKRVADLRAQHERIVRDHGSWEALHERWNAGIAKEIEDETGVDPRKLKP